MQRRSLGRARNGTLPLVFWHRRGRVRRRRERGAREDGGWGGRAGVGRGGRLGRCCGWMVPTSPYRESGVALLAEGELGGESLGSDDAPLSECR